jgi:hypothetical protein
LFLLSEEQYIMLIGGMQEAGLFANPEWLPSESKYKSGCYSKFKTRGLPLGAVPTLKKFLLEQKSQESKAVPVLLSMKTLRLRLCRPHDPQRNSTLGVNTPDASQVVDTAWSSEIVIFIVFDSF